MATSSSQLRNRIVLIALPAIIGGGLITAYYFLGIAFWYWKRNASETLQKLGPACVAAFNAYTMCADLPKVAFLAMDARHCAGLEMAEMMAYAASVGSTSFFSSPRACPSRMIPPISRNASLNFSMCDSSRNLLERAISRISTSISSGRWL